MTLPLIDLDHLRCGQTDDRVAVGRQIRRASETVGFFYVGNHGITDEAITEALSAARRFFARPEDEKRAVGVDGRHRGYLGFGAARMEGAAAADLKESYAFGVERTVPAPDDPAAQLIGPNQWPSEPPEFAGVVYDLFLSMVAAGRTLLSGIALALDLPAAFFEPAVTDPLARGSLIHYPPRPAASTTTQFGVGAHTDFGLVTLLWQDGVGGLEVQGLDGHWLPVPPVPGTLVVNVGDLLARWSNDRLRSNPHRVVNPGASDRYSIAVFLDPAYETAIDPRDSAGPSGGSARYPRVLAGDYIIQRFESSFAYRRDQR